MTTQTRTAVCRMDSAWRKDAATGYLDARVFPTKAWVSPYEWHGQYKPEFQSLFNQGIPINCEPELLEIYTDGGVKKNRAAWAMYIPKLELLRSGIVRKVKRSDLAEAIALEKAYQFVAGNYPGVPCRINTDCLSLYQKWQNGGFGDEMSFLTPLLQDNFILVRWVPRSNAGISTADEACTMALNYSRQQKKAG